MGNCSGDTHFSTETFGITQQCVIIPGFWWIVFDPNTTHNLKYSTKLKKKKKTLWQLITFELKHITVRNLPVIARYQQHELPLRSIRIVLSNARLNRQESFILQLKQAQHPALDSQRCNPLSGLIQYGLVPMHSASHSVINFCHRFLVPVRRPLASWHPWEAAGLTAT